MPTNQEYRRFGVGYFSLGTPEARQFDTATHLILADAWLELAKESSQLMHPQSTEFATWLHRWVFARFK
jgi:hypothetical protein